MGINSAQESVVKIWVTFREPDQMSPWRQLDEQIRPATAFAVGGNNLLTTAHVVSNWTAIRARRFGSTKNYDARVVQIDHERELALLQVDDETFFAGISQPQALEELPDPDTEVVVIAASVDSEEPRISTGNVKSVEMITYVHSDRFLLALQVDAVVEPGASGAPVLRASDGKLLGVVCQLPPAGAEPRFASIVPYRTIAQMQTDLSNGRVDGVPELGIYWQNITSDALAAYLAIPSNNGVLVNRVAAASSADGVIKPGDIVVSIGETSVLGDGSIEHQGYRLHFLYLVSRCQIGQPLDVELIRDRQLISRSIVLKGIVSLVGSRPEEGPSYVVFAGLVFIRLSYEHMRRNGFAKALFRYKYYYFDVLPTPQRLEIVVLAQVLEHTVNKSYLGMYGVAVETINGVQISSIADVADALEKPLGRWHVIEVDNHGVRSQPPGCSNYGRLIILDVDEAAQAHAEILKEHHIEFDRSKDLRTHRS